MRRAWSASVGVWLTLCAPHVLAAVATGPNTGPVVTQPRRTDLPRDIGHPVWMRSPGPVDIAPITPAGLDAEGAAMLRCDVVVGGTFGACEVIYETPSGRGVGDAALKLRPLFKMAPDDSDGVPVAGGSVIVRIYLSVPGGRPLPPYQTILRNPDWVRLPSPDDIAEAYPAKAAAAHVPGRATLSCVVGAAGDVERCTAIAETPSGIGFGDAALALSPLFRMKLLTLDSVPVAGARVIIPINFEASPHN